MLSSELCEFYVLGSELWEVYVLGSELCVSFMC